METLKPEDFKIPDLEAARNVFVAAKELADVAIAVANTLVGQGFESIPFDLLEASNKVIEEIFKAAHSSPKT